MNDFASSLIGIVILSLLVALLAFGIIFAVPIMAAVGVGYGFYQYHNRPSKLKRQDIAETNALYKATKPEQIDLSYWHSRLDELDDEPFLVADKLFEWEDFTEPEPPPNAYTAIGHARYRDQLARFSSNRHMMRVFTDTVVDTLKPYNRTENKAGSFVCTRPRTADEVEAIIYPFFESDTLFQTLQSRLDENLSEQNQVIPSMYKGDDVAGTYFQNTPLIALKEERKRVSLEHRTEHTYIVAASGHGKTQLIQQLVAHDIAQGITAVVIDSQRQMLPKLANLNLNTKHVAYISPNQPLALNLFKIGHRDSATVTLLQYVLSSLMGGELTAKQSVIFEFLIQFMLHIPDSHIGTFMELLKDHEPYAEHLAQASPLVREFITTEYTDKAYDQTRKEIRWRIWSLMKNPIFSKLFLTPENHISMKDELNRKLILIDADIDTLQSAAGLYGRMFVAMLLQEAQRRFVGEHPQVNIYLDEAYLYLDESVERMLETSRKANMGLTIAHQYLDQIEDSRTLQAVLANTATKLAGTVSDKDARTLAPMMGVHADQIRKQPTLQFTLSQKTDEAVKINVDAGLVERTGEGIDWDAFWAEMNQRYAPKAKTTPPKPPEQPEYELEPEWGDEL